MEKIQLDDGRLGIQYSMARGNLTFNDTIVGDADYINALTDAEIEAIKTERFENWYALVTRVEE